MERVRILSLIDQAHMLVHARKWKKFELKYLILLDLSLSTLNKPVPIDMGGKSL